MPDLSPRLEERLSEGLSAAERVTIATYEAQAATWTDALDDGNFWAPQADRFAERLPAGRVLDLGCGSGRDAELLSGRGYEVTGLDLSYALLQLAARRAPQARFVHGSMYELPFPDASFDGAWATASLLHVPRARIGDALGELARVLRPGANIFCALKPGEGEQLVETTNVGPRFFCYWTAESFTAALAETGLSVDACYERKTAGGDWLCLHARSPSARP